MSTIAITADTLSKRYQRGMAATSGLLRDTLAMAFRAPHKLLRRERKEQFWALKDVSLEVQQGEVLGLIGRNGSGKTTLLKILSRITRPTAGWAEIHGRVGSLLEVGTGFHPELTGRENTYLSGAILGMGKQEIARKFDEIVSFAELEQFIDTPVKHYSSGMYVRLAFAVAAHLEPEILLVDEVLAVGDIRFQRKCLGKMGDVARAGRTVILVTHQLNQIRRLCDRVVWLDGGALRQNGPTAEVVSAYETDMTSPDRPASERIMDEKHGARFLSWNLPDAPRILPTRFRRLDQCASDFYWKFIRPFATDTMASRSTMPNDKSFGGGQPRTSILSPAWWNWRMSFRTSRCVRAHIPGSSACGAKDRTSICGTPCRTCSSPWKITSIAATSGAVSSIFPPRFRGRKNEFRVEHARLQESPSGALR